MNRNLIFAFLLLAALAMVDTAPYRIYLPCPYNPSRSSIYADLKSFPLVSNQPNGYTVEKVMLDYKFTPYKTEIIIVLTDQEYNLIGEPYFKVLDLYYANAVPFSIDVSDIPTPQILSAYTITLIIADKNDDPFKSPEIHACTFANFD
ncbi:hypothetical protein RhiirA4_479829 [Rhizophagus irregularis]|uniref:Uncharacterized protein n=1 Tax=Rhizophagus irregularis TaxID=588596 RepID=A0A2I1HH03_9GLOM|nr:hypothetical protein RhiirA4_479829 [Rhizophagus irregularis]